MHCIEDWKGRIDECVRDKWRLERSSGGGGVNSKTVHWVQCAVEERRDGRQNWKPRGLDSGA